MTAHSDRLPGVDALESLGADLTPALGEHAQATWLVGGVVRDALLGRDLVDVDLVTVDDPEQVARRLARVRGGTPFPLSDRHGAWRVALKGGRHEHIDVAASRAADLAGDLAARDFTLNAIAAPVSAPSALVDPTGGIGDIESGTVRMVAPSAFDEDPLRLLRAVRIAHVLGMELDDATLVAMRERAHLATRPSGERTFLELCRIVEHPEARRGMRLLDHAGLEPVVLPELAACAGLEQSRFHHLDVRDHTLAVLDNCEDILDAADFWLPLPTGEPGPQPFTSDQRRVALFAAIAHDLGKPSTHTRRPGGSPGFVGHDAAGAVIVDTLCDRWRTSTAFRSSVKRLVATHLALGYALHGARDARAVHRVLVQLQGVEAEGIVLSVADRLATAGPDDRRRWVRAHLEFARRTWAEHWRRVHDGLPEPLLDGTEIAEAVGIAPGPDLGRLVVQLAEAQAVGEVSTRAEAVEYVRSLT